MTKQIEAMRLALEALEYHQDQTRPIQRTIDTITALREALDEPVQEPVGYFEQEYVGGPVLFYQVNYSEKDNPGVIPLFAAPPRREWVSLTDEEINNIAVYPWGKTADLVRAISDKLKEKNCGS